ncbi:MAG: hypothetical protein SPD47_11015 [Oscillospiraceae bacterium]|nr:hypothetical protein [Oscillospiraceae bacterium]
MKNNSRLGVWVLIPGFVLAFAARMAQLCAGTDMTSGFLKYTNGFFMNYCFWGAVLLTIGGAVAATVIDRKKGAAFYQTPVSGITDSRAAAIGFAMLVPALGALYEGYSEMRIPKESDVLPSPFMMWVDFIFGAAMLVVAFFILYNKEFKPGLGFATVVGAVYYTLRGIGIFMEKMAVTTVPEYLINCISVILSAVFFMQLAKLLSGNEGKHTRGALAVSGAAAVVTILANSLSGIAAMLFGPAETASRIVFTQYEAEWLYQANYGESAYYMSLVPAADAAAGVFALVVLIALFMKPKKQESAASVEESAEI